MSHFDQNQPQIAYPLPNTAAYPAAAAAGGPYSAPPPPPGYPTRDVEVQPQSSFQVQAKTQLRDDGFLKGCLAALCCCCVVEECCF